MVVGHFESFFRAGFCFYVALAMLYTTLHFWLLLIGPPHLRSPADLVWSPTSHGELIVEYSSFSNMNATTVPSNMSALQVEDFLSSPIFSSFAMEHQRSIIGEDTFLAKAFPRVMQPMKIIPFYYKSTGYFSREDITITTLVTSDRFAVFKQLVERYQGPISATIHVPLSSLGILQDLHALYISSSSFSTYVDVHLVLSPFYNSEGSRQFNAWRNLARVFAKTKFVMMLDVDFVPCTDFRGFLKRALEDSYDSSPFMDQAEKDFVARFRAGTAALVVPAFEYVKQKDGADQSKFPTDKAALIDLAKSNPPVIASFHASWAAGHNSTDYPGYYSIPPDSGQVYKVKAYQSSYEPYVIFNNRVTWCEERFTGYGANKAACLFEMYLSGVDYYVLADHFLIHQSHKYEEQARKEERKYNRKLYRDFKEEICLRYIQRFWDDRLLHTSKADNAKDECTKLKGIAKIIALMIDEYVGQKIR